MIVDIHTHAMPKAYLDFIRANPGKLNASIQEINGVERYCPGNHHFPLFKTYYDVEARLAAMDERKIDVDVLSVVPFVFLYDQPADIMIETTKILNDGLAEMAALAPDRFRAIATVPMQDVDAACKELRRAVEKHGFRGVEICTTVNGKYYDEPEFFPFFQLCQELDLFVLFHPNQPKYEQITKYYLSNYIGNPMDTTVSAARIVFGGVLKKLPGLKLIFVHGGGMIPYQHSRFGHGHAQRQEGREFIGDDDPGKYFDMLYFDIITHDSLALEFLIKKYGAEKILLGTDYPFDMQDYDPVGRVKSVANVSEEDKKNIMGLNALNQFYK